MNIGQVATPCPEAAAFFLGKNAPPLPTNCRPRILGKVFAIN
jgi:hypothetical protein